MSEFKDYPQKAPEAAPAGKAQVARTETPRDEEERTPEQLSQLVMTAIHQEAQLDPAFAKKLNEWAVQATIAAEKLVDYKQLWKTSSLGEKLKMTPGMARAVVLMGLCNSLTEGVYANVTGKAVAQAKQEGLMTPDKVKSLSGAFRAQGWVLDRPPAPVPHVPLVNAPQVQPPLPRR